MRIRFCIVAVAVALSACTTTEQANDAMASRFTGQSADSFFLKYGPPLSFYQMDSGQRMYVWAERQRNIATAGTSTVTMVGKTAIVNTTPGSNIAVQCQVRLVVGQDGKIQQITAQSDSIGLWQMSRCNEIFGQK